jgi:hypothetical protein
LATVPVTALIPILFFGVIAVIILLSILSSSRKMKIRKSWYNDPKSWYNNPRTDTTIPAQPRHERYVPGQFSQQMELDMRLPYRRFKKLYPGSNITYQEYKDMQMKSAFRRSMSSQENKRMVR